MAQDSIPCVFMSAVCSICPRVACVFISSAVSVVQTTCPRTAPKLTECVLVVFVTEADILVYSSLPKCQFFAALVPELAPQSRPKLTECALVVFVTEDDILVYSSLLKCQLFAALVSELAPQGSS